MCLYEYVNMFQFRENKKVEILNQDRAGCLRSNDALDVELRE
jgi:hypothetical protein